jgi:hypothetical protein
MRGAVFLVLIFSLVGSASCQRIKRHSFELKCHLYVENFEVNPFGIDEVYLTDSLSFRIFIGKYDIEHETFSFVCKENDVMIYKRSEDKDGVWKKVDSLFLSRADLTQNKIDSTQPLFEFK